MTESYLTLAWTIVTGWVFICSILSWFLPPPEMFDEFPKFQRWYRLGCKLLKWFGALDLRARVNSVIFPESWEKIRKNGS